VAIGAPQRNRIKIIGIEEEEPLQLRPSRRLPERPVRSRQLMGQNSTGMTTNRSDRADGRREMTTPGHRKTVTCTRTLLLPVEIATMCRDSCLSDRSEA
jgi:hypothetical protein